MEGSASKTAIAVETGTSNGVWTRLRCSRCRYASEHPGGVRPGDLDRLCALCGCALGAVTVYRLLNTTTPRPTSSGASVNSLGTPSG
jgi:hypothetical protein